MPSHSAIIAGRLVWLISAMLCATLAGGSVTTAPGKPGQNVAIPAIAEPIELLHDATPLPPSTDDLANMPHLPGVRIIWMQVTAYCPCSRCCGPRANGVTASGRDIGYNDGRFVAADTSLLPFGSVVRVPGYNDRKPVEVIDRGSAIVGNRLDVFFPTHDEALAWGRRWVPVIVSHTATSN